MINQKNTLPRMRTLPQAAQELGVPLFALRNWVKGGQLPAVYAGRKAFIDLDNLISFLRGEQSDEH